MKKTILCVSLVLFSLTAGAQALTSGIDLSNLDTTVRPGDDFYQYAVGSWLKNNPLDAEHSENGAFTDISEATTKQVQGLINEASAKNAPKGSIEQKIGDLYNLAMDSVRLNREGAKPIMPLIERIRNIQSKRELQLCFAQLDMRGAGTLMFGIGVGADQRDADNNLVSVGQGGLGLDNREYYFGDDPQTEQVRAAYKTYITTLYRLIGLSETEAEQKFQAIMALETKLASSQKTVEELRDIDANYHKMSYNELVSTFTTIDWGNIFLAEAFPPFGYIDVSQPEAIHGVEQVIEESSLDDLKTWGESRVLMAFSSRLSDEFRAAAFKFGSAFTGATQDRPRWKRATSLVSGVLGEAIGKLYVERYFPEANKQRMLQLVSSLQEALRQRIEESTWMGEATKVKAIDKLNNFHVKIGYPDRWRDYSGLQVDTALSLVDNMMNISEYTTRYEVGRTVNKPVDRDEWLMTPQTINAYYNPTTNEICFPAAILQPPFFDINADDAANYGAIGIVIGHEMSHGFDDQGAQFDKTGNQSNWWTDEDKKNFDARTKVLADYFSTIAGPTGKKINGQQTLGENIGDNGGIHIAYRALQNSMKKQPLEKKDGFTPEQRFFLSHARVWAANMRPEIVDYLIVNDVHSPNFARVNGALAQVDEWYEAFGIKKGKLFVPKKKRAQVW